ncbi:Mu transposase domain-containing protein [Mangrovicoccus ximenensis]|uniref:Mu transposase domain-containing protein n=1 Tax=Mangrovicoccus ximenensis TaxID=1911570 RepID=UPI0038B306F6
MAISRKLGIDRLVSFESRQHSVPFHLIGKTVELRRIAGAVQVLKSCEIVARHPRGKDARLLIDQSHYDGESDDRVIAPPPLCRMGRKIRELIDAPVARRPSRPATCWRRSPDERDDEGRGTAEARHRPDP